MNDLECTTLPEGLNLSSMASIGYFTVTNTSLNESGGTMPFQGSSVVTAVISLTVFVVGLLGNTLAIYVVLRYAKMKTVTNMYILNLALADELYILGIPFLTTQNVLSYWPYGEFLCRVIMTADTMNQFTSTYCLTVMSIDRYLAVVHPIRSAKWRRPQVAKVINAMVWVVSFLVGIPVIIFSDVQDKFHVCNMSWPEPHQDLWSTAFILYTSILGFFGPLLIICLCYLLIVIKVKSAGARAGLTKRRRSERKVTRMVVIIVVVFVLCWLPFFTTNIVNLVVIIPETSFIAGVYFFAVTLTYVNSCANPLLYGFLSENFKQSFQKVLCIHKVNGVGDRDPGMGQPRTQKVVTHDTLLKPRRPHFNGHMQNNQCVQMESCGSVITERLPSETPVIGQPTL